MQGFYNDKTSIVNDAINSLVLSSAGKLARFPPDHPARVVLRADWDKSQVAIISGGGSGHEPAHAGLVGEGLLTAAVCGDVFASPSVDAVLSAILAVTGDAGCLIVIKNYTGDRLNFGLAAEQARAMGLMVETVVVADDVSIPGARQPRGIAGTLFIHKVAGYMADKQASLADIAVTARAINQSIVSLGVSRDTCLVPGNEKSDRLKAGEVEIGLGIHGEPGIEVSAFASAAEMMADIWPRLQSAIDAATSDESNMVTDSYAVLFNNLGGLSGLECSVILSEFLASPLGAKTGLLAGPAALMTALDMPGFSLSLVPLTDTVRQALQHPVSVASWPGFLAPTSQAKLVNPPASTQPTYAASSNPQARTFIETLAKTSLAMENDINALDAKVGDGDTGSTFAGAGRTLLATLDDLPLAGGADLLSALSAIKMRSMGGSSGVLFAIFFAAAAEFYARDPDWYRAFSSGLAAMKSHGGAKLGDRTLIDALEPAINALVAGDSLQAAAVAARAGADSTAAMDSAGAGRSAYLDARSLSGVTDPGAEAIARLLESLASS